MITIKTENLFLDLGYTFKTWKAAYSRIAKKLEIEKADVLETDEVLLILNSLASSSSKYKANAQKLLETISDDGETISIEKVKSSKISKDWKQLADDEIVFSEIFEQMANDFAEKEFQANQKIAKATGEEMQSVESIVAEIKERYKIIRKGVHMGENIYMRLEIYTFPRTKVLAKLVYDIMVNEDVI